MRMSSLRALLREAVISEVDISDLEGISCTAGSTHVMKTCKLGKDKYFLKFSDASMFEGETDPSLQILIEYLAYKIYALYPGVRIPKVELVYDKAEKKVGLATSAVQGKPGRTSVPAKKLGKMLSAGVYVDVFLANWDVVGTDAGNVIVDKDVATRIDPGGSLTFRAQGGRKGNKFASSAGELKTMLDPSFGGAGEVLSHADMQAAAKEFQSVGWQAINSTIKSVAAEVSADLKKRGMLGLEKQWLADVAEIASKLASRHKEIAKHVVETQAL